MGVESPVNATAFKGNRREIRQRQSCFWGSQVMIRRSFLKLFLASPLLGLLKSRKSGASTGLTVKQLLEYDLKGAKPDENGMIELTCIDTSRHCWVEAINCEPETWYWDLVKQSILGIDADSQILGTRLMIKTGQVYECWPRRMKKNDFDS